MSGAKETVWDVIGKATFTVWTCPEGHTGSFHGPSVEWDGDVAHCLCPGCGQRSDAPVYAHPTEYQVSALPVGHRSAHSWSVWVQWRSRRDGVDLYCVADQQNGSAQVYHWGSHEWVWEPLPSERREDFIAATRFPLEQALSIAKRVCQELRINGLTAHDILKREAGKS